MGRQQTSQSSTYVGPGCAAETLFVCEHEWGKGFHYDLSTYLRIDLTTASPWLSRAGKTVEGLVRSLGTPYDTTGRWRAYLALDESCALHEPARFCYVPMIWILEENDEPRWLFVAYHRSCRALCRSTCRSLESALSRVAER
jgi:hypothetical protein